MQYETKPCRPDDPGYLILALYLFNIFNDVIIWPLTVIYFIAAFLMKPGPVIPIHTSEEQEFYNRYVHSRKGAADRIIRRYRNLEGRIQRLEDTVTTRELDWEHRMNT